MKNSEQTQQSAQNSQVMPANQTETLPSSSTQPSSPADSLETTPKKPNPLTFMILLLIAISTLVGVFLFRNNLPDLNSVFQEPRPASEQHSLSTSSEAENSSPAQRNAMNQILDYSVPTGWKVETFFLSDGEIFQRHPYQHKFMNSEGVEMEKTRYVVDMIEGTEGSNLILFNKDDAWYVSLLIETISEKSCGDEGMISDMYDADYYKELTVLGQPAIRPHLEKGNIRIMPEYYGEARSQIIQGRTESSSNGYNIIKLPFCLENKDRGKRITILYHSPYFVASNFDSENNKTSNIDHAIIKEMDAIVESLTFKL